MQRFFALLSLTAGLCGTVVAQHKLVCVSAVREIGSLLWHSPGEAVFQLTNTADDTLRITEVRTDCGCTVARWEQKPIPPKGSATVAAVYDAELLGRFTKSVAVYTDADEAPIYLQFSGNVVMEKADEPGNYPVRMGEIYLDTDNIEFDDVHRGEMPSHVVHLYNAGKQSFHPELMHLPRYLSFVATPEVIRPGRTGKLVLEVNTAALDDVGLTQTGVYLSRYFGDHVQKDNEINVSITLLPEAAAVEGGLLADTAARPVCRLSSTLLDLGSLDGKKKKQGFITLTNEGGKPLEIQKLQVYNPGLGVSLPCRTIAPGESVRLKITVKANSHYFKGSRRVLLITNDPQSPKNIIDIRVRK